MYFSVFLCFVFVIGGHFVGQTDAIFPWNQVAGVLLRLGGPILKTPPLSLFPEAHLSVDQIIKFHGYASEEYEVVTDDGYILTIQRIRPSCASNVTTCVAQPIPILLVPGIVATSSMYVFNGKQDSPAFILADAGYDVWLANNRGTIYGRRHETLSPDNQVEFWNFTFHEMGIHDLPSTIDFVLEKTGNKPQLHLVAVSMGTDLSSVLLSERPEYNSKVKTVTLMATTLRFSQFMALARSPLILVVDAIFDVLEKVFQNMEVLPLTKNTKLLGQNFCGGVGVLVCRGVSYALFGYDPVEFDKHRIPTFMNHYPAGTSFKNFRHFFQLIKSSTFQHYDYGRKENLKIYGTKKPTPYDMSKISAPMMIVTGARDILGYFKPDIEWLAGSIGNLIEVYHVPSKTFNHLDFSAAIGLRETLFNEVISTLSKYS